MIYPISELKPIEITISPLAQLEAIKKQIDNMDQQIADLEKLHGIDNLREEKAIREQEYKGLLENVVASVQFSEDKFLKAQKKSGDSYREGDLKLIRRSRTVRSVITDKFVMTFPELAAQIAKIEVKKAEDLLGAKKLDEFCEKKISYSYELINMNLIEIGGP